MQKLYTAKVPLRVSALGFLQEQQITRYVTDDDGHCGNVDNLWYLGIDQQLISIYR